MGSSVCVVLFDYQKAFDLINHRILANKIIQLSMPLFVKEWVIAFLIFWEQHVKLFRDCFSDWGGVRSGVPWLFILMINYLKLYQKDPNIQIAVDYVQDWSTDNCLHLNDSKCRELLINFNHAENSFQRVKVKGNCSGLVPEYPDKSHNSTILFIIRLTHYIY